MSKKKYEPTDDNWFKSSYPIFVRASKPKNKEELYKIIAYAYSWMPTIPNVKVITKKEWRKISKLLNNTEYQNETLKELLSILIPIINNSLVGTSKVLHFINSEQVPIIDSRVLTTWNKAFKKNQELKLKKTMLLDSNKLRQVNNYLKYRDFLIAWKVKCGKSVSLRKLEELLYYQKI